MVRPRVRSKQHFHQGFFRSRKSLIRLRKGGSSGYNGRVEFTLRDFRTADFEKLWEIDQKCFPPGIAYSRFELATYIRRRGAFTIVALIGGSIPSKSAAKDTDIAGFIVAESNARGMGHIISIDILPEHRRSGLGSLLMSAAEERLLRAQCHVVVLETAVDNFPALSFYKRLRYHVVKTVPRYYPNGMNAVVLQKSLFSQERRVSE